MALQWQIVYVCLVVEIVISILLSIPLPDIVHKALTKTLRFLWRSNVFRSAVISYFTVAVFLIYQSYQQMTRFAKLKSARDEFGGLSMREQNMSQMFYHQRNFYLSSMTALLLIIILGFMRHINILHALKNRASEAAKAAPAEKAVAADTSAQSSAAAAKAR